MRTLNISCTWKKLSFLEKILDIVTYIVNLFAVSFFITLKINILQNKYESSARENLKSVKFVLIPQRLIREKQFIKWSYQQTWSKWIKVSHTSSQIKAPWLVQGRVLSLQMIVSCGIKFSKMFWIVLLITETCLLTPRLWNLFSSQIIQWLAFPYWWCQTGHFQSGGWTDFEVAFGKDNLMVKIRIHWKMNGGMHY